MSLTRPAVLSGRRLRRRVENAATGRETPDEKPATIRLPAFATEAVMAITDSSASAEAESVMHREVDAIDRACSRFRADAELLRLYEGAGRWVPVSPLLFEALSVARRVAKQTDGAVDPTVGRALERLGYDRDFASLPLDGPALLASTPAPGWRLLELDPEAVCARVPEGVRLDLGSSVKALAADRIADQVASLGTGVVVGIGGDVSIAGPAPAAGWHVGIAADAGAARSAVDQVVAMWGGGMASSSTGLRTWDRGGRRVHHIVDPATGDCAPAFWRLVSVAASSCVDANAASTAAIVWGEGAPGRIERMGLAARLVRYDGAVVTTARWPAT